MKAVLILVGVIAGTFVVTNLLGIPSGVFYYLSSLALWCGEIWYENSIQFNGRKKINVKP